MIEDRSELIIWLFVWIAATFVIVRNTFKKSLPSVGLPSAFILAFSIEHWFGALVNVLPWHRGMNYEVVKTGFIYSTFAVMAFAFGQLFVARFIVEKFRFRWIKGKNYIPNPDLIRIYLIIGFIFYFILMPVISGIPSVRTLAHSSWNLIVVGVCLGCWNFWKIGKRQLLIYWLIFACVAPFFTMITGGFLGVGTMTLMIILCFVSTFYRPRIRLVLGTALAVYVGLSLFVNYMEWRTEIRRAIAENKPMDQRIEIVLDMLGNFSPIDLRNDEHIMHINARLNQNYLMGSAVIHMQSGREQFAGGDTIKQSLIAIVPRILWPAKPMVLGGSELASKYTGLEFGKGVSVGIGLPVEFYINFGLGGIVLGFIFLGTILRIVDITCANRLIQGNWEGFIYWFMPPLSLIASASLINITMTMAASIVFCVLVNKIILPQIISRRQIRC